MLTQKLMALVLPEGLLLAAAVALVHWEAAAPQAAPVVRAYPAVVVVAGALLAWRFGRGRVLLALVALTLAAAAVQWLVPFDGSTPFAGPEIVRAVAMALPATLAALAFLDERGLHTIFWLRRLAMLAVPAAAVLAVWLLSAVYPAATAGAFDAAFLPPAALAWLPLGQPAAVVALAAVLALVARAVWRPDHETGAFLWAAVAAVIAMGAGPAHGRATLYLANAGLVLVAATVETAYAMAYRDELTGLAARRALDDALKRLEGTYTVAMVDVDHFKAFNDTYGHETGDQVLRMVAGRLARVRGGGQAFRYGGEEFALLFPGKTVDACAPHLEAVRESVAAATFALRGRERPKRKPRSPRAGAAPTKVAVTVSIGAAHSRASAAPENVVKAADRALYRAKQGGRNRLAR
ncbi:MAG: GGDEF domain-containing protein [Gemmatimonadota bacterium]|nr:GGDEF domain-containing protein [Gemmatimonadota bacterium]MDE3215377.1 GGDEF domain-containing protein [Gemmatimonadota bacterium]